MREEEKREEGRTKKTENKTKKIAKVCCLEHADIPESFFTVDYGK